MNTNGAHNPANRPKNSYTSTLLIILLIIIVAVLLITRYNRAPEPIPSGNIDSNAVKRLPPDSLPH